MLGLRGAIVNLPFLALPIILVILVVRFLLDRNGRRGRWAAGAGGGAGWLVPGGDAAGEPPPPRHHRHHHHHRPRHRRRPRPPVGAGLGAGAGAAGALGAGGALGGLRRWRRLGGRFRLRARAPVASTLALGAPRRVLAAVVALPRLGGRRLDPDRFDRRLAGAAKQLGQDQQPRDGEHEKDDAIHLAPGIPAARAKAAA